MIQPMSDAIIASVLIICITLLIILTLGDPDLIDALVYRIKK